MNKLISIVMVLIAVLAVIYFVEVENEGSTSEEDRIDEILDDIENLPSDIIDIIDGGDETNNEPVSTPIEDPIVEPTVEPTIEPTIEPTEEPTVVLIEEPTQAPVEPIELPDTGGSR